VQRVPLFGTYIAVFSGLTLENRGRVRRVPLFEIYDLYLEHSNTFVMNIDKSLFCSNLEPLQPVHQNIYIKNSYISGFFWPGRSRVMGRVQRVPLLRTYIAVFFRLDARE
jgi:hypothetical protein